MLAPSFRYYCPRLLSTWTHCEYQLIGDVLGARRALCLIRLLQHIPSTETPAYLIDLRHILGRDKSIGYWSRCPIFGPLVAK